MNQAQIDFLRQLLAEKENTNLLSKDEKDLVNDIKYQDRKIAYYTKQKENTEAKLASTTTASQEILDIKTLLDVEEGKLNG